MDLAARYATTPIERHTALFWQKGFTGSQQPDRCGHYHTEDTWMVELGCGWWSDEWIGDECPVWFHKIVWCSNSSGEWTGWLEYATFGSISGIIFRKWKSDIFGVWYRLTWLLVEYSRLGWTVSLEVNGISIDVVLKNATFLVAQPPHKQILTVAASELAWLQVTSFWR